MKSEKFSWDQAKFRRRNHLPHVDVAGGLYFVTWCLADAVGKDFLSRMAALRRNLLDQARERFGTVRAVDHRQIEQQVRLEIFSEMDRARGRCELKVQEIGQVVMEALLHFQDQRYHVESFCVMPNHVHVVFQPQPEWPWWKITGGWKSFTSKQANRILRRSGKFWQDDSYETLVRSAEHLERANRYVLRNPEKAGLQEWPWVGRV